MSFSVKITSLWNVLQQATHGIQWRHYLTVGGIFVRGHSASMTASASFLLGIGLSTYNVQRLQSAQKVRSSSSSQYLEQIKTSLTSGDSPLCAADQSVSTTALTSDLLNTVTQQNVLKQNLLSLSGKERVIAQPVIDALSSLHAHIQEKHEMTQLVLKQIKIELRTQVTGLCQALRNVRGPHQQNALQIANMIEQRIIRTSDGTDPLLEVQTGEEIANAITNLCDYLQQQMTIPEHTLPFGQDVLTPVNQASALADETARNCFITETTHRELVDAIWEHCQQVHRELQAITEPQFQTLKSNILLPSSKTQLTNSPNLLQLVNHLDGQVQTLNAARNQTSSTGLTGAVTALMNTVVGAVWSDVSTVDFGCKKKLEHYTNYTTQCNTVFTTLLHQTDSLLATARSLGKNTRALEGTRQAIEQAATTPPDQLAKVTDNQREIIRVANALLLQLITASHEAQGTLSDVLSYRIKGDGAEDGLYEHLHNLIEYKNLIDNNLLRVAGEGACYLDPQQIRYQDGRATEITVPLKQLRPLTENRIAPAVTALFAAIDTAKQDLADHTSTATQTIDRFRGAYGAHLWGPALIGILGGALALGVGYRLSQLSRAIVPLHRVGY